MVVESKSKNILFLSRITGKEENEVVLNNMSKSTIWNTSFTISNDSIKIEGVLGINYYYL
jgi:hypothetical protein